MYTVYINESRLSMREIVLDTETTGMDPDTGDRIVEIGCVELENHMPTGRTYHQYINPQRDMSAEVIAVHGLTSDFLSDKPTFEQIADAFLAFLGQDYQLVIHNAAFDMKFLNAELSKAHKPILSHDRVIDTLLIARQKFPGSKVNLNALCKRFGVDNSSRTVHGALLDSELLADVYLELIGGREPGLILSADKRGHTQQPEESAEPQRVTQKIFRAPRSFAASAEEIKQHTEFVAKIKDNLWGING